MADVKRVTLPPEFVDTLKPRIASELGLDPNDISKIEKPQWVPGPRVWRCWVHTNGPAEGISTRTNIPYEMNPSEFNILLLNFEREKQLYQQQAKEQLEKSLAESELGEGQLDRLFEPRE
jgi:hypothetical protein